MQTAGYNAMMAVAGGLVGLLAALYGSHIASLIGTHIQTIGDATKEAGDTLVKTLEGQTGVDFIKDVATDEAQKISKEPLGGALDAGSQLTGVIDGVRNLNDDATGPILGSGSALLDLANEIWGHPLDSKIILGDLGAAEGKLAVGLVSPEIALAAAGIDPILHHYGEPGIMDTAGELGRAFVSEAVSNIEDTWQALQQIMSISPGSSSSSTAYSGTGVSNIDAESQGTAQSPDTTAPETLLPSSPAEPITTASQSTGYDEPQTPEATDDSGLQVDEITDPNLPTEIEILNPPPPTSELDPAGGVYRPSGHTPRTSPEPGLPDARSGGGEGIDDYTGSTGN